MSATRHDLTLDVFDRKSGKLIKQVPLSNRPNNIAVAKDGRIVVGIARGEGALDIIDPATLTLKKTIPVNGRLHNVYVTPDSKYVITGSIPKALLTVIDLATEQVAWETKIERRRPADGDRGQPGRLDQADLRAALRPQRLRRGRFRGAQGDRAHRAAEDDDQLRNRSPAATPSPSHGIGVTPDNKTLWVTSIPNNAVFVYSLDDLKMVGQVALPALKLPGHEPISAVANWVTFTPDSKTIYVSNAGSRSVTAIDIAAMKVKAVVRVGEVPKRINTLVIPGGPNASSSSNGRRASLH